MELIESECNAYQNSASYIISILYDYPIYKLYLLHTMDKMLREKENPKFANHWRRGLLAILDPCFPAYTLLSESNNNHM